MKTTSLRKPPILLYLLTLLLFAPGTAQAALNPVNFVEELNQLVLDGNQLIVTMQGVNLEPMTMNSQLTNLETSTTAYLQSVKNLYQRVSGEAAGNSTLSLTDDMLVPLQTLSTIVSTLAVSLNTLTGETALLATSTDLSTLRASLYTLLKLADDIGLLADRIVEMGDKILLMADNIGIMANQILATQLIQSDNLKYVVDIVMQSRQTILMLFSMIL